MQKQRVDPTVERRFSIILVVLIALGVGFLIARMTTVDNFGFTPDRFEEQLKKADAH